MKSKFSRREVFIHAVTVGAGAALQIGLPSHANARESNKKDPFKYSLNTSTIRGQKLTLPEEVDLAAKAGYDAIEPWVGEIETYANSGGSLEDLKKRIHDKGLTVESSIGFFDWIVDDENRRAKGLEGARRSMDLVQKIGGKRIAAPPAGATDQSGLDLLKAAERYRALLEIGDEIGVVPQMEVWGFSKTVGRLGEAALVAMESHHPKACVLADVYHLHRGGSAFDGLKILSGTGAHIFHVNDYPATPPREQLNDGHRIYPGDGVAPYSEIIRYLIGSGYKGFLSLELFNQGYWSQDALTVAKTGLEKTRAIVRKNL